MAVAEGGQWLLSARLRSMLGCLLLLLSRLCVTQEPGQERLCATPRSHTPPSVPRRQPTGRGRKFVLLLSSQTQCPIHIFGTKTEAQPMEGDHFYFFQGVLCPPERGLSSCKVENTSPRIQGCHVCSWGAVMPRWLFHSSSQRPILKPWALLRTELRLCL